MSVQQLHEFLIDKLQLKNTGWLLVQNPMLVAASMHTTADDYDRILSSYLSREFLPKSITDELEKDYLANGTKICDWCGELTSYLGHYGMCNWFECLGDSPDSTFTEKCRKDNIHNDAGLFGFYPLLDRAKGMHMSGTKLRPITAADNSFVVLISTVVLPLAKDILLKDTAEGHVEAIPHCHRPLGWMMTIRV